MNKAVTVLHCDRFCIIIANCPSPHTNPPKNRTILRLTLNLPPLSKVRCCRPKKFGRLPEGLPHHQPFQNRTILLAFRTAIVCVLIRFRIRTIPRKALSPLPPLEKGEVACRQAKDLKIRLYYAIYQTPAYLQLFCLQDGGD